MQFQDMTITSVANSFMNSNRTGNILYDIIISSLIMTLLSYINNFNFNIFYNIYTYIIKLIFKSNASLEFKGTETRDKWGGYIKYPKTIMAIFHYVSNNNNSNFKNFREINNKFHYEPGNTLKNTTYAVKDGKYIINNNINCIVKTKLKLQSHSDNNRNEEGQYVSNDILVTLDSIKLSSNELKDFINKCIEDFELYTRKLQFNKQFYFEYLYNKKNSVDEDNDESEWKYMEFNFKSNKNFNNIYFPEKSKFINTFDFFINNKEWYKKRGVPYRFGILMYGPPGTGKTSTIKAILNETKRHAVVIPLSKIKSATELKQIFFDNKINGKKIYTNEKIIIFEDIDCMTDIVKNRNYNNDDNYNKNNNHNFIVINNDESKKGKNFFEKNDEDNDKITLSILLNLLDGIMEDEGRIIIMTSNHPEKLDPALTRPGRIDYHLNLSYADHNTIKEIIENNFHNNININKYSSKINKIKNNIWSPAEIIQLCIQYQSNIDSLLDYLINNEPIKF